MMPGEMETKRHGEPVLGCFRDDIREMAQHFPVVVGEWCLSHNPKGMDAMSDWEKSLLPHDGGRAHRMGRERRLLLLSYADLRACRLGLPQMRGNGWMPDVIGG